MSVSRKPRNELDAVTIREALETLCNEASYADSSDSAVGVDINNQTEAEALRALDSILKRGEAIMALFDEMVADAEKTEAALPSHSGNGQPQALAALARRLSEAARTGQGLAS